MTMNRSSHARRYFLAPLAALAGFVLLAGCGGPPDEVTVSGNVQVDGAPLTGGTIAFLPVGAPESAKRVAGIDENGNFNALVRPDQYMVTVEPMPEAGQQVPKTQMGGYNNYDPSKLPPGAPTPAGAGKATAPKGAHMDVNEKYAKFATSGLMWDVKKDGIKKIIQVTK